VKTETIIKITEGRIGQISSDLMREEISLRGMRKPREVRELIKLKDMRELKMQRDLIDRKEGVK
jgi:hypothetical protein